MGTALPLIESGWDELVAGLPYGVVHHDEAGAVVTANPAAAELLALSPADLRAGVRPPGWRLCDDTGADVPTMREFGAQLARAGSCTTLPFVVTVYGSAVRRLWADLLPNPNGLLLVLRPVSAEPARDSGLLDPVTGLPHRALLFDRIEQSLARAQVHGGRTTLVLADLCGLRTVNQTWGFERGDHLLALIGSRLRKGLRPDHTVSRYTGGTFAVVADHQQGTGAEIAERVRELATGRARFADGVLHPLLRTGWTTGERGATVHSMVCAAEESLGP